jgi:hypothetical protein
MYEQSRAGRKGKERKREESENNTSAICTEGVHMCANICHGIHYLHFYIYDGVEDVPAGLKHVRYMSERL